MKLLIAISRGILRDFRARRLAMMGVSLAALLMVFVGSVPLGGWLREHPLWFLLFWAACAWLTACAFLLAIFDLLMVRAEGKRKRAALAKEILEGEDDGGR